MYRSPGWPPARTRRSAAIRTLRLPSATKVWGQTFAISSDLLTTSPGRSTSAIRRSKARPLTETGSLPFSKSRLAWSSRNGPKNISSLEGSFSRSIVWIPGGDLCRPPRDSELVIVISGILWLAISERDSSLGKLKSISRREDTPAMPTMRSRKFGWQRHGSCPKHRRQPKPKAGTRREMPDGFNPTTALGGSRQLKAVIGLLNEELKARGTKTSRGRALRAAAGYRLPLRDRKFADSPLEGDGFEPSVPHGRGRRSTALPGLGAIDEMSDTPPTCWALSW